MRLLYYQEKPNFGDALNPWLWSRIFPNLSRYGVDNHLFIGIGSIFDRRIPGNIPKTIFGAGIRSPNTVPKIDNSYDIRFVRGPISARHTGARPITDSALCLRLLDLPPPEKEEAVGFMPHFLSEMRGAWRAIARLAGMKYISPSGSVEETISAIRSCSGLVTEAMHGAIVADMYRVPWAHVVCGGEEPNVRELKWADWCESLEMAHRSHLLPALWSSGPKQLLKVPLVVAQVRIATSALQMSDESVLSDRLRKLEAACSELRRDFD